MISSGQRFGEYRRRNADITLSGGRFILPARSVTLLAGK